VAAHIQRHLMVLAELIAKVIALLSFQPRLFQHQRLQPLLQIAQRVQHTSQTDHAYRHQAPALVAHIQVHPLHMAVVAQLAIQVAAAPAVQYHVQQVLHSNLTGLAYNLLAQQDLVQHPATGLPARPAMVRHQRLPALTAQAKPQIAQLVQLNRLTAHVCKAEAPRLMPAHRRQSSRVMPARLHHLMVALTMADILPMITFLSGSK